MYLVINGKIFTFLSCDVTEEYCTLNFKPGVKDQVIMSTAKKELKTALIL